MDCSPSRLAPTSCWSSRSARGDRAPGAVRRQRRRGEPAAASAGDHRHGSRRPRQDHAPRQHSLRPTWWPARQAGSPSTLAPTWSIRRRRITFIDTPGHAAFTQMRARGAQVTDIVVLVVAADDGVMPQTIEAINHARRPRSDRRGGQQDRQGQRRSQRVLSQLAEHELVPEAWGGDTIVVEMSAPGRWASTSCSTAARVAELEELTANPEGRAKGIVSRPTSTSAGPVATVLVDKGELRSATRSWPVRLGPGAGDARRQGRAGEVGRSVDPGAGARSQTVPHAGDEFRAAPDEKIAGGRRGPRAAPELKPARRRPGADGRQLEDIFSQIQSGETAAQPRAEGRRAGLARGGHRVPAQLDRPEVELAFVHRAVGGITENDITLAATTKPRSSASTSAGPQGPELAGPKASRSVPTRSSTSCSRTSSRRWSACSPRSSRKWYGEAEVRGSSACPDRRYRRLLCALRHDHPGSKVRFLRDGTIIWKGELLAQAVQGRCLRSARASSAASASPTSRTSSRATDRDVRGAA